MKREDYYKAQDLLTRINMIECAMESNVIDDKAIEKLDTIMRASIRDKISGFAKSELMKMKLKLENEFNSL